MNITVNAHIRRTTELAAELRENEYGRYVTLEVGNLTVFIRDREKLLEVASLLERAAQQWEGES